MMYKKILLPQYRGVGIDNDGDGMPFMLDGTRIIDGVMLYRDIVVYDASGYQRARVYMPKKGDVAVVWGSNASQGEVIRSDSDIDPIEYIFSLSSTREVEFHISKLYPEFVCEYTGLY